MSKRFKLDDNVVKTAQRVASVTTNNIQTNNIQPEQNQLCANMISEVIKKVAAERVINKGKQRTASLTTTSKIDEVGLLKGFLTTYQ